ncbi:MAG: ABC transporter permease [Ilumatobacteraceae bacterium]
MTKRRVLRVVGPLATVAVFVGLWYFMSEVGLPKEKRFLLPPPHRAISESLFDRRVATPILEALWRSTQVALVGLAIAMVLGVALAVLMSRADWIEWSVWPLAVGLQCIPILALTPLIGGLLGFSFKARLVVTVMISLFPIMANTLHGLLSLDRSQYDLFAIGKASKRQQLWKLQLPAALPSMLAGFRIAAGLAVVGAVVGDTFFRQGKPGIGALIDVYRTRLQGPEMIGAIVLAAMLGFAVFALFGVLSRVLIGRWYQPERIR